MLFGDTPDFDGETYDRERDHARLATILRHVQDLMSDGKWRSLWEISQRVQAPEASVSARLRDLRKRKFGGHTVERRHIGRGLWEYRYTANPNPEEPEES